MKSSCPGTSTARNSRIRTITPETCLLVQFSRFGRGMSEQGILRGRRKYYRRRIKDFVKRGLWDWLCIGDTERVLFAKTTSVQKPSTKAPPPDLHTSKFSSHELKPSLLQHFNPRVLAHHSHRPHHPHSKADTFPTITHRNFSRRSPP